VFKSKGRVVGAEISRSSRSKTQMIKVFVKLAKADVEGTTANLSYLLNPDDFYRSDPAKFLLCYGLEGRKFMESKKKKFPKLKSKENIEFLVEMSECHFY
jgi:hypothetical protein